MRRNRLGKWREVEGGRPNPNLSVREGCKRVRKPVVHLLN